jgi:hypothetical protein
VGKLYGAILLTAIKHINCNINKRLEPLILPNKNKDYFLVGADLNTLILYTKIVEFDLQRNLEYSCFDEFKIMAGMMTDGWNPSH